MFMLRITTLLIASLLALPGMAAAPATVAGPTEVRDLARSFDAFWQRSQQDAEAERVARFKQEIAPLFADFYGIERYHGRRTQAQQDDLIGKAITAYPAIREEYLRKAAQFERDLPRYTASFQASFPDYRQQQPIYFLNSLFEMDGGTRELSGRAYLIFGIDGMVRYHGVVDEAAFFHHELFHTYHAASLAACDSDTVWVRLWSEGLATYVSKALNPGADEKALLLDIPEGLAQRTRLVLGPALAQLESVLDSSDPRVNDALFSMNGGDDSGFPGRRGYYLGYLIAQEAARGRTLDQLARLDCTASREVLGAALQRVKQSVVARDVVQATCDASDLPACRGLNGQSQA
jgi:hypothetical protein